MKSMIQWFTNEATGVEVVIAIAAIVIIAALTIRTAIDILKNND